MLIHAFLRRFIVIGYNGQTGRKTTKFIHFFDEFDRIARFVGTDTGNQRNTPLDNLDTSRRYYREIITTRNYDDRLATLENVRKAGMKICSGGILGMGEGEDDRLAMLVELANLNPPPESVPINQLVRVKGTPLAHADDLEPFDFIRVIAVARILMPKSAVRLSAGRESMNEQMQALCFMAGTNSIFYGCKLLTTPNPEEDRDAALFAKLDLNPEMRQMAEPAPAPTTAAVRRYYPKKRQTA